jgi:hypothetical protein
MRSKKTLIAGMRNAVRAIKIVLCFLKTHINEYIKSSICDSLTVVEVSTKKEVMLKKIISTNFKLMSTF